MPEEPNPTPDSSNNPYLADSNPPPLPGADGHGDKGGHLASILISWLLIVASVVFLALSANYPTLFSIKSVDKEVIEEAVQSSDSANELALLKIQSRLVIGVSDHPQIAAAMGSLEGMGTTPKAQVAIATVYAFIDAKGKGQEKAFEMLDQITDEDSASIVSEVRQAIEKGVTEAERDELAEKIGWFAELIKPSENIPGFGDDIRASSKRTAYIMFGFMSLLLFVFLAGVVVAFIYLIKVMTNSMTHHYKPHECTQYRHLFLESFAVYIFIMALGHILGQFNGAFSMITYAGSFLLAILWPIIRGCPWKESFRLIGWNRGQGVFREIGAGILGYFGIFLLAIGTMLTTIIIMGIISLMTGGEPMVPGGNGGAQGSHPIVGMLDAAKDWKGKLMLIGLAAVSAPLVEEAMFRGALFRFMRHRWAFIVSALIGGVIFAVVHPQGWIAVPALSAMGIGFTILREWRDSVIAPMVAHAINNGALVLLLISLIG